MPNSFHPLFPGGGGGGYIIEQTLRILGDGSGTAHGNRHLAERKRKETIRQRRKI